MIANGTKVIITELPAGRKLPAEIKKSQGVVVSFSKYGATNFFDIDLDKPVDGVGNVSLIRESSLFVIDNGPSEKEINMSETQHKQKVLRHEIEELKDELKAWPLPKSFDKNSEMYIRVWRRRLNLHRAISKSIQEVEGRL